MRSALSGIIFIFSISLLFGANFKSIPIFTKDFVRSNDLTRLPLNVDTGGKAYPDKWNVRGGIPFPKGELKDIKHLRVLNTEKKPVPFQARPLAWWNKDSIKWLEVEFQIGKDEINPQYYLEYGPDVKTPEQKKLAVRETNDAFIIDTGKLEAEISKKHSSILEKIKVKSSNGAWDALKNPVSSYIELRDIEGNASGVYSSLLDKNPEIKIERQGSESVTFLIKGYHRNSKGRETFPTDTRVTFFKDQPRIKIMHTFYVNENPAVTFFPTLGMNIPLSIDKKISMGVDKSSVSLPAPPFAIWQDSSEIPIYPKCNQFAPFCKVYKGDTRETIFYEGKKADGWIRSQDDGKAATVTLRRMWQEFPKGFAMSKDGDLKVEYWPKIKPDPMDLRRIDQRFPEDYQLFKVGEGPRIRGYEYNMKVYHRIMSKERELITSAFSKARTHEIWLDFSSPEIPAKELASAADRPLLPFVAPAWNRYTNALGVFHPEDKENFPVVERAWELSWDTLMKHQTKWSNWYGMWNWGDFQTNYHLPEQRWGYYNTKYSWRNGGMDIPYSIFLWYLRSGKRKYFDLAEISSLHLMDATSTHPRAWEDERLFPKGWKGGGTSRYDKNHWGSGGGYDPEHLFAHSVQMNWLATGNNHAKDNVMSYALNYYNREKAFNYKKYTGKDLHYHGRESDMPSRLAGNAYENEPTDPRWKEMLDFYIGAQAESFRSMFLDKTGKPRRKCNNLEVLTFYYILYKVPAMNYLLTLTDSQELRDACKHGMPLRRDESGGGLSYMLLYQMTGNKNYAKFASRQAAYGSYYKYTDKSKPDKNLKLIPHTMGGMWSTYPGLLEAAVKADLELAPKDYDDRELNYYPLAQPAKDNKPLPESRIYEPLDIRSVCNWAAGSDSGKAQKTEKANDNLNNGEVIFDFGPEGKVAPGALSVTGKTYYPSTSKVRKGFSALPFGSYAQFNNVLFGLLPYSANNGKNMLNIDADKSYEIPVGLKAKEIFLLTGASNAKDPFHQGAGATVEIKYKDGEMEKFDLVNMKHYQEQSFKRLYFSRKYYAGRLNEYNVSVVGFDTKGKDVESIKLSDAGKNANLKVFAVTAQLAEALPGKTISDEKVKKKSKDKIVYEKEIPNGRYTVGITCKMSEPLGSTLDVYVQGQLAVNHVVPVAKTTYEIPVEITDGKLEVELYPGEMHHKSRSVIGEIELDSVRVSKLDKASFIPVVKKDKETQKPLMYGWKLRGQRAVLRDLETTMYRGKEITADKDEILLNWDTSYIDKYGVGKAEFIVDLPNGKYDLDLVLSGSRWGAAKSDVSLEIEGVGEDLVLPQFKQVKFRSMIPVNLELKKRVTVKDGQLNITAALPPKGKRKMFDACGVTSLKIKKSKQE